MFPKQFGQSRHRVRSAQLMCALFTAALSFNASMAHAELTSEQRYQLCSSFPHNSQCEGYTAPVALDNRSGEAGYCLQEIAGTEQGGECKFVTSEQGITAYIETGEPLDVLDEQRSTVAVSVEYAQVQGLDYREFKKSNKLARGVNTFLFGAIGFFATKDKPVAEVVVRYAPTSESNDASAEKLEQLSLIFDRDKGYSVRTHLESKTELRSGVPADELPVLEETDATAD